MTPAAAAIGLNVAVAIIAAGAVLYVWWSERKLP
jgi:hypothetical protein